MKRAQSLSIAGVLLMAAAGHAQVEQWDRWETSLTNTKAYGDPIRDVALDVTITTPDGRTIPFWGFHDGGTTWRVRWMPDRTGTWRYDARFSDGQPGKSGSFTSTASNRPGTVRALTSNSRWFATGNKPFLPRSFQASGLFKDKIDAATRTRFLDWAAAQGYNTFSSTSFFSSRDATDSGGPKLWPIDAAHFRRVESVLNDLSRRGMVAYAFTGFFPNSGPYPTARADQTRYIRYCLARFGPYWNVILNVGGFEVRDYLSDADIRRLGAEIAAANPFKHLLGAHQRDGDDIFRNDAWCSFATLQHEITNLNTLGDYLRKNYAGKPVYGQETLWMGNSLQPGWTTTDLRKHMWVHMMSAAAYNAGDMSGSNDSGFSATLQLGDRRQERHDVPKLVWDFMVKVPWERMSPRQDLRTNGFMLAEPGARYLCYLPTGGAVDITVAGGPFDVEWINARDPLDRRASGTTSNGLGLRAPDGEDWLVYLTSGTSVPPPPPAGTVPAIDRLRLMNADDDQPMLDPLPEGAVINLASLPSRNLTIQALTTPATIGSVRFAFDGNNSYRVESVAPYAIAGDNSGDLLPWAVGLGAHSVGATPYAGSNGTGTAGTPVMRTFTIVDTLSDPGAPPPSGPGSPPPAPGPVLSAEQGGDNDNGDGSLNDRCGGAVATSPGPAWLLFALAVALAIRK